MAGKMTGLTKSVLIVEDQRIVAMGLSAQIEDMGLEVCAVADTAQGAVASAGLHRPAVILMDMRLRGERDGAVAALAIRDSVGSKIIYLTGSRDQQTVDRIDLDNAFAVLFKPVTQRQLESTVRKAMAAAGQA
jgi:DNA-binding NarL/FixJ family response regulator